ncbi:MAG: EAL domain-containing protein [Rhodocyclaceae bacterium]|nr:EAL domain-containing protein [Rhodocyclaceae bacterium]
MRREDIKRWLEHAVAIVPVQQSSPAAWAVRFALAPVMVAVALVVREVVGPPQLGLPFLTFFPAATLAAVVGGLLPGLLATAMSAAFATYLYLPPFHALSFDFAAETVSANALFCGGEIVVCLAIQAMHRQFREFRSTAGCFQENRHLLQAIVEGTTDAIFVKDAAGRYRLFNSAAAQITGRQHHEVIGRDDTCVFPAAEAQMVMAADRAVMAMRKVMTYEDRVTSAQGEKLVMLSTKGPLFDHLGNVQGIFGISRDITRSKKAADADRDKLAMHDQLAKIAASVPGVICSFRQRPDGSSCFPYASPGLVELYGLDPEAVLEDSTPLLSLIHPDDVDATRAAIAQSAASMTPWHAVFRVRHPRKGEIWVEGHSLPLREADGGTLWHGYVQDITVRIRAEEQMRLAARVFDRSAEGVVITDVSGRILTVNAAFTTMTGYAAAEAIGKTPALLQSGRHGADFYAGMWQGLQRKGGWQGEIWNRRKNGEIYLEWLSINAVKDADGRVINYVALFSDITVAREAQERMEFLATHDELTDLPNRTLFHDRLRLAVARAERAGTHLAILCVDLDDFKVINDTLGHETGDILLVQAALRLRDCVRAEDSVARMGGDEFVVLLEAADKRTVTRTAARIVAGLSRAYQIGDRECFTSASIGISVFPDDAAEPSALLRHADNAMYRAKEQGKNTYQFFSREMAERAHQRLVIESGLRRAIVQRELFIEYQPQVDSRHRRLVGAEALVRWRRDGAVVPPLAFIPVAEETGLINDIGEWVVAEVGRQIQEWDAAGLSPFNVSVNISARHFRQADMVARIQGIVAAAGLDPRRLCLEITEGALADVTTATSMLAELRTLGFEISIDDFGTGFSSLSHLKRFPINELKVDRSFVDRIVTDRDDRAIAAAIIGMARSLDLRVVAEGVETVAQLTQLQKLGCDIGQGYFYARPLAGPAFDAWLRRHEHRHGAPAPACIS